MNEKRIALSQVVLSKPFRSLKHTKKVYTRDPSFAAMSIVFSVRGKLNSLVSSVQPSQRALAWSCVIGRECKDEYQPESPGRKFRWNLCFQVSPLNRNMQFMFRPDMNIH